MRLRNGARLEWSAVAIRGGNGPGSVTFDADASSAVQQQTPVRSAASRSGPFTLGATVDVIVNGPPGDLAAALVTLDSAFARFPFGPVFLEPTTFVLAQSGVLDAQGRIRFPLPMPSAPTMEGVELYVQPATVDTGGMVWSGGPTAGVLLR